MFLYRFFFLDEVPETPLSLFLAGLEYFVVLMVLGICEISIFVGKSPIELLRVLLWH